MTSEGYVYNLGQRFLQVAQRHARRPAIRSAARDDVSYAELAATASRASRWLARHNIGPGALVALQNSKSLVGYAVMLACLMRGAAYVNLDPGNPAERLRRILAVCRPAMVVADGGVGDTVRQACESTGSAAVSLSEADLRSFDGETPDPVGAIGTDVAYVMFTSGSTGMPKGVAVSHASVLNFVDWARATFSITPLDVLTGVNPIYFDNSVFDFYGSIFNGACLAPMHAEDLADPAQLVHRVDAAGCTIWFSVPSLLIYLKTMKVLGPDALRSVRSIIFGGEGYPKKELTKLHETHGRRSRLFNVYGPTECTCICSAHEVTEGDLEDGVGLPTLGFLAPNFRYRLLDGDTPVPPGEAGELGLIGPQVALGYYNDPERTAASFVRDPLSGTVAQPMYRTGDLVREVGGRLYFVGRADNQIKHMGYRVELEEIESAVHRVQGVSQAAVVYRRVREGFGHIVAHVACPEGSLAENDLREALRSVLPAYMLPNRYVITRELPKNANGKVDRVLLRDLAG